VAVSLATTRHEALSPRVGCPTALGFVVARTPGTARIVAGFTDLTFTGGHLSGDRASVDFRSEHGTGRGRATLRLTAGRWRVENYTLGIFTSYLGAASPPAG
jgi:hypothetical protein